VSGVWPARWTRRHLALLSGAAEVTAPVVSPWPGPRVLPEDDVWDLWPVQEEDGSPSVVLGEELWMTLAAPVAGHPEDRHGHARLRLLGRGADGWRDLGNVFADGTSPGSREWSGSAVRRPDGTISVFYTVAGRRGEPYPTFTQRVAEARPRLITGQDGITLERDVEHREILRSDGRIYLPADEIEGGAGRIRAFRDPGWFRDPADGSEHLLIAASVPWRGHFMGAIALADARSGDWSLRPPLLVASGVNHELERPHIVVHDSTYYLFFVTQRHTFHPRDHAPTGLYGFAAPTLTGPYRPLNGSGLVIRNPTAHPDQAYAWLVLADLRVVSFLNYRSVGGEDVREAGSAQARAGFGGTVAPVLKLALDGLSTSVVT
jgi:levansucrase